MLFNKCGGLLHRLFLSQGGQLFCSNCAQRFCERRALRTNGGGTMCSADQLPKILTRLRRRCRTYLRCIRLRRGKGEKSRGQAGGWSGQRKLDRRWDENIVAVDTVVSWALLRKRCWRRCSRRR